MYCEPITIRWCLIPILVSLRWRPSTAMLASSVCRSLLRPPDVPNRIDLLAMEMFKQLQVTLTSEKSLPYCKPSPSYYCTNIYRLVDDITNILNVFVFTTATFCDFCKHFFVFCIKDFLFWFSPILGVLSFLYKEYVSFFKATFVVRISVLWSQCFIFHKECDVLQ